MTLQFFVQIAAALWLLCMIFQVRTYDFKAILFWKLIPTLLIVFLVASAFHLEQYFKVEYLLVN